MTSTPSIYPIHRLPPELVAHIFISSLPKIGRPNRNWAPLNISSVCMSWRQIAISTPPLWSRIHI
ncbi:hypothetical protein BD410DRAFT_729876, partial [Rickenella mellea]